MVPLAVVTPSYAIDYELCRDLCHSLVCNTSAEVMHHLVVPEEDLQLFAGLANRRCRVWSERELLPRHIVATPRLNRAVRRVPRLPASARVAAMNRHRPFPPIRGWILQQVLKIEIASRVDAEVVLLLDSDVALARPVAVDDFRKNGQTVLYRKPGAVTADMEDHVRWHNVARRLLGLAPGSLPRPDYVSSFMAWDSSVVAAMQARITEVNGRPWADVLAGQLRLSEWTLYGVFADEVLGWKDNGIHRDVPRCHEYWDRTPMTRQHALDFVSTIPDTDLAIMISAKSRTPLDVRRAALRHLETIPSTNE